MLVAAFGWVVDRRRTLLCNGSRWWYCLCLTVVSCWVLFCWSDDAHLQLLHRQRSPSAVDSQRKFYDGKRPISRSCLFMTTTGLFLSWTFFWCWAYKNYCRQCHGESFKLGLLYPRSSLVVSCHGDFCCYWFSWAFDLRPVYYTLLLVYKTTIYILCSQRGI